MAKKKKLKKINKVVNKKNKKKFKLRLNFDLPDDIKKKIYGIIMFLTAVIISLSFFHKAGKGGEFLMKSGIFLIGKAVFIIPLLFIIGGLVFFFYKKTDKKFRKNNSSKLIIIGIFLAILGITGIMETLYSNNYNAKEFGGLLGYLISYPFIAIFGIWGAGAVFTAVIIISAIIFYQLAPDDFWKIKIKKQEKSLIQINESGKPIKIPEFKVKEIKSDAEIKEPDNKKEKQGIFQKKKKNEQADIISASSKSVSVQRYKLPSLDLLEKDKGTAYSGDIRRNSAIIKQTFENFNIAVQMEEINIGPTVTQYTLIPSQGVKLSKITALNNDLSLALAAHPIRIEAPIPGRSLVGIELPNKTRTVIGMRTLLEAPKFQDFSDGLLLALGKDVAGNPIYADLCKMPHLLVAGSTGSGKTICLNSIILSLLYKNSPKTLRMILVDPKRVEFPVYNSLPHLLSPVIYNAQKTVEALKWLTTEMERRFDVLSGVGARDIKGYNKIINEKIKNKNKSIEEKQGDELEIMPYIVLIIDELADVMAAKGREVEAEIVRLSQMSRAVGIHIILATQRPSVEVLTGLIKANIISRITFKVASQVDSRTILDMAGAEKLLGAGDMLFISSEHSKPKRIQGIYTSEKEVKKSIDFIKQFQSGDKQELKLNEGEDEVVADETADSFKKAMEFSELNKNFSDDEDPLYEEAKEIAIQAKKASASLFQRRLRIGYARAARLIDSLEEKGVIGPGDGARPREILVAGTANENPFGSIPIPNENNEDRERENALALKHKKSDNEEGEENDNNEGFTKL
ncbi:MAG: DNA translocase FtsK 4TM domain-containing protein [Patescibacteria group bacterium]|nr:DNA translocase FtsK 4TM domain-containing protein [Patescibacteria group bacterium]